MKYTIKISNNKKDHLIPWLRFIQSCQPHSKVKRNDVYIFDFRNADFMQPYHLTSLACLIELIKKEGGQILFKLHRRTQAGNYLRYTKFDRYWNRGFNRNFCFSSEITNTLPIWHLSQERIDSFATAAQNFYQANALPGKDLTQLRLTVVEALNNVCDHSQSKIVGFVYTQFYKRNDELVITICDFGVGIPKKVNNYLQEIGEKPVKHNIALEKALTLGFTTKSRPNNGGFGLDNILGHIKAVDGEIQIVSNKAFYSKRIKNSITQNTICDEVDLSFNGTFLMIKLNTSKFQEIETEKFEEMEIL